MYWFTKPPWVRWCLSALLILFAFGVELRQPTVQTHLFAIEEIAAGTALSPDLFRSQSIPSGLLAPVTPIGVAAATIRAGDPLLSGSIASPVTPVPDDWWALEIGVPAHVQVGDRLLLVLVSASPDGPPAVVDGIATSVARTADAFGATTNVATVAIPPDHVTAVATAVESSRVSVLTAAP